MPAQRPFSQPTARDDAGGVCVCQLLAIHQPLSWRATVHRNGRQVAESVIASIEVGRPGTLRCCLGRQVLARNTDRFSLASGQRIRVERHVLADEARDEVGAVVVPRAHAQG